MKNKHPRIKRIQWGKMKIQCNGINVIFKDCILSPKHCSKWNWRKDGTRHAGITIKAIKPLLYCDIIILSKGMDEKLKIPNFIQKYLKHHQKKFYILETKAAVQKYRKLTTKYPNLRIGGLFHSTC